MSHHVLQASRAALVVMRYQDPSQWKSMLADSRPEVVAGLMEHDACRQIIQWRRAAVIYLAASGGRATSSIIRCRLYRRRSIIRCQAESPNVAPTQLCLHLVAYLPQVWVCSRPNLLGLTLLIEQTFGLLHCRREHR